MSTTCGADLLRLVIEQQALPFAIRAPLTTPISPTAVPWPPPVGRTLLDFWPPTGFRRRPSATRPLVATGYPRRHSLHRPGQARVADGRSGPGPWRGGRRGAGAAPPAQSG